MDPYKGLGTNPTPSKGKYDIDKRINNPVSSVNHTANIRVGNVRTTSYNATSLRGTPDELPAFHPSRNESNESNQQSYMTDKNNLECSNTCFKATGLCNSRSSSHNDTAVASTSKIDSKCDKKSELNQESESQQNHNPCTENASRSCDNSVPSKNSMCDNLPENNSYKENRKRPSTLKLNKQNYDEESSSDTGNDDYSLGSEDGCIYTYRGGEHSADLPSSFFNLDMGLPLDNHLPLPPNYPRLQQAAPARQQGSRASSPDMDFLEMDFDPGPSCEVDSGDDSTPDAELDAANNMPEESEPMLPLIRGTTPEYLPGQHHNHHPAMNLNVHNEINHHNNAPSTSRESHSEEVKDNNSTYMYGPYITHVNARGEHLLVRRTMSHWTATAPTNLHISSGDLVSPREILNYEEEHPETSHAYQINQGEQPTFDSANLSSTLFHHNMAKRLLAEKAKSENESHEVPSVNHCAGEGGGSGEAAAMVCAEPPRCMVWSEREACERQATQIGTSACGATAVVNVFIALGVPVNVEKINSAVGTRQRANNAPLPRYLVSRAVAGCTAAELVAGIQRASDGLVTARFFPTYPERAVSLPHWLADWISIGAVPILTLNLQAGCESSGEPVPDAWHHQMVFGVSPRGVYLCNPVECARAAALWPRLASPSTLLVRARDVLARFSPDTDLTPLAAVPDRRFHTYNVLGQVVNLIRESRAAAAGDRSAASSCGQSHAHAHAHTHSHSHSHAHAPPPRTRTRHVRIPAAYRAGVTVAALTGSEAHRRLMHAPQLPHLAPPPPDYSDDR